MPEHARIAPDRTFQALGVERRDLLTISCLAAEEAITYYRRGAGIDVCRAARGSPLPIEDTSAQLRSLRVAQIEDERAHALVREGARAKGLALGAARHSAGPSSCMPIAYAQAYAAGSCSPAR